MRIQQTHLPSFSFSFATFCFWIQERGELKVRVRALEAEQRLQRLELQVCV